MTSIHHSCQLGAAIPKLSTVQMPQSKVSADWQEIHFLRVWYQHISTRKGTIRRWQVASLDCSVRNGHVRLIHGARCSNRLKALTKCERDERPWTSALVAWTVFLSRQSSAWDVLVFLKRIIEIKVQRVQWFLFDWICVSGIYRSKSKYSHCAFFVGGGPL